MHATKKMKFLQDKSFIKEMSILASVSLITYYFAMKGFVNKSDECCVRQMKNDYIYLKIELMQIILKDILEINK